MKGDGLLLQDYGALFTRMDRLILLSKELPMNVIWIFNVELQSDKAEDNSVIEMPSAIGKKAPAQIPHKFNEVYHIKVKENKDENTPAVYIAQFKPYKKFPHGGTKTKQRKLLKKFPNGVIENPSWDKIKDCFGSGEKGSKQPTPSAKPKPVAKKATNKSGYVRKKK